MARGEGGKVIALLCGEIILGSKVMPWGFFESKYVGLFLPAPSLPPPLAQHVNCTSAADPLDRVNKFKGSFYIMWARLLKPFVSFSLMRTDLAGSCIKRE